jgi:hypothetical protein
MAMAEEMEGDETQCQRHPDPIVAKPVHLQSPSSSSSQHAEQFGAGMLSIADASASDLTGAWQLMPNRPRPQLPVF